MIKKVLISGISGFVGSHLSKTLKSIGGYQVVGLVRGRTNKEDEIQWDPNTNSIDKEKLLKYQPDIVLNFAGESIVGRWTDDKKKSIMESRIKSTDLLCHALLETGKPPSIFIGASGCSYYGSQVNHPVDERSPKGVGFFPDLVEAWEGVPKRLLGIDNMETRLAHIRMGVVLDGDGGYLKQVKLPFKLGLGGKLGNGKQYFPWVSLKDVQGVVKFLIDHKELSGAFNVTSPNHVTNAQLTDTIGHVLHRPTIFTVPEFVLTAAFGQEMVENTFMADQQVIPRRLLDSGYKFIDSNLELLLKREL